MTLPQLVQKFGGTSVGSADAIRRVGRIVHGALERRPLVVVSAVGGITDRLLALTRTARANGPWKDEVDAIAARHRNILRELDLDHALVDLLLDDLVSLARGIALVAECTARTQDLVASFGERISARIVAAHLASIGVEAVALDAWDAGLVTDSRFGGARPLASADAAIRAAFERVRGVAVVTGFLGRDERGAITTLGRGGSDWSAAIFGAALDVREIQIWTDVDGVLSADPRKVPKARVVPTLSYAEAAELAFFGAKVLHPATMAPAVKKSIPIRVLNTFRPEQPGTRVCAALGPGERGVKSFATKGKIAAVNVVAGEMMLQFGFLERIADAFARHEVVVDVIATSEVSVALTVDSVERLDAVVVDLAKFAQVTVVPDLALLSVVGEELKDGARIQAQVLGVLADLDVRPEIMSYGATRNNLSVVIANARLDATLAALHARFFE